MNPCQYNLQQRRQHTNLAASFWGLPTSIIQQQLDQMACVDACAAAGIQQALAQLRHGLLEG